MTVSEPQKRADKRTRMQGHEDIGNWKKAYWLFSKRIDAITVLDKVICEELFTSCSGLVQVGFEEIDSFSLDDVVCSFWAQTVRWETASCSCNMQVWCCGSEGGCCQKNCYELHVVCI